MQTIVTRVYRSKNKQKIKIRADKESTYILLHERGNGHRLTLIEALCRSSLYGIIDRDGNSLRHLHLHPRVRHRSPVLRWPAGKSCKSSASSSELRCNAPSFALRLGIPPPTPISAHSTTTQDTTLTAPILTLTSCPHIQSGLNV